MKALVKWILRVVFVEHLMSETVHVWLRHDANQDGGHDAGKYVVSVS